MPSPDIPNYTFGCELELILPRANNGESGRTALAAALTAAGVDCRTESYNHLTRTWWKIVTDVSIGHDNCEVVAPILSGEAGLDQVRHVCRIVDDFGCTVNRHTGMHVHVGMREPFGPMRVGVFKEVLRTYHRFESVFDQLTAPSRRGPRGGGGYCTAVRWTPQIEGAATLDALFNAYSDRAKVNLHGAYFRHGTVEFRHHQGTINGEKATNWIKLMLRLVAHAAKNTERSRDRAVEEYRPASYPRLPELPRYLQDPIDYARCPRVNGDAIPRFINANDWNLQHLVITYVIDRTPRREGTAGRENHDRYNVMARRSYEAGQPMSLLAYHRAGGRRTHLAWDVDHGYVRVVDVHNPPWIAPSEEENQRREAERERITAERERLEREYQAAETERRAAFDAARRRDATEEPPVTRPATDTAPVTLEGLFDLLELSDSERGYFTERHMELNP